MSPSSPLLSDHYLSLRLRLAAAFFLLAPFITFLLLWLKGIPSFAASYPLHVLAWVYSVTWVPAMLAGALLAGIVSATLQRTAYFHAPYDFGRCFSLGAILGALAEALSTWLYRHLFHRPFSDFWIAGAMMAGCLAGGIVTAVILWRYPVKTR